jgi:sugar O-acyltransferase (sialic acid O-acetyltransferase NeuD family)
MGEAISIIGFGKLGQQFLGFINQENDLINVFDDFTEFNASYKKYPFDNHLNDMFKDSKFYVAIGYKHLKLKFDILHSLKELNRSCPSFIHRTSFINESAIVEDAVFIYPMCNIDKNVSIKKGVVINNSVTISHDSQIAECCYISPGVIISGDVEIKRFTFIGSGAIISNGIKIGENVKIGIGSVITQDIPDNSNVIGNPMRFLINNLNL